MPYVESPFGNVVTGTALGSLLGGSLGLGACTFIFDEPPLFTGDTILIGAAVCGFLGYWWGGEFVEWLKENIWNILNIFH